MHVVVKWWLGILLTFALLWGLSNILDNKYVEPWEEEKSVPVVLVQAYSTLERSGKYGREEVFMGRFLEKSTGIYWERHMNGFFYHSYVEGGRKDTQTWLAISDRQRGIPNAWSTPTLLVMALSCAAFLTALFAGIFVPAIIEEYEHDKRRTVRMNMMW